MLAYACQLCDQRLAAYREAPHDVEEHANIELSVLAGGYAYRQIAELVQNAADAVADAPDGSASGRITVLVDEKGLWTSNTGAPLDAVGVKALLASNASGKRAGQIGRFGPGFKSLLKLGGRMAVLSRSVCLHSITQAAATVSDQRSALLLKPPLPACASRSAQICRPAAALAD